MNSSVLLVFWHGIGDCIISTPAFREFHRRHPDRKIYLGVNDRVFASGFFDECDYVEDTFQITNPWLLDADYRNAVETVVEEARVLATEKGIDDIKIVSQYPLHGLHKITRVYRELGLGRVTGRKTEIYVSNRDRAGARRWLEENRIGDFVFLHGNSSHPEKDLPRNIADEFIRGAFPGMPVVEPGIAYSIQNRPVGFSFAILEKAGGVVVVDSAFLHAADALGKPVDLAYFNLRPGVSEEVRSFNTRVNIVRGPNEKRLGGRLAWSLFKKPLMVTMGIVYGARRKFGLFPENPF